MSHNGWYWEQAPFEMTRAVEWYGWLGQSSHTFYVMVNGKNSRVLGTEEASCFSVRNDRTRNLSENSDHNLNSIDSDFIKQLE